MKRIVGSTRDDWQRKVEDLGFHYHSMDGTYWDESAYYRFNYKQIDQIERATNELYELCLDAVRYVIKEKKYDLFKINPAFIPLIERSWDEDEASIYGRFDFSYDGIHPPKLLEFNADTPTSLYEAAVVQWFWSQEFRENVDQFNSIHEKLIDYLRQLKRLFSLDIVYFSSVKNSIEDYSTVNYLQDCANQAGLTTKFIYIEDIGWDHNKRYFVDLDDEKIVNIFKLYPWEWLMNEEFGGNLLLDQNKALWIEPAWKMILSNKAILPILWSLYPNHENLLPAYFTEDGIKSRNLVIKPLLSREGANVVIKQNGQVLEATNGEYGAEGFVYQEYCPLPCFDGNYPLIGSWVIGGESAGIGIRESKNLITDNQSRFIPHIIEDKLPFSGL